MDTSLLQIILTGGLAGVGAFLTVWLVWWHVPAIVGQQDRLVKTFEASLLRIDEHCRQETKELRDLAIAMMKQVCDEARADRALSRESDREDERRQHERHHDVGKK